MVKRCAWRSEYGAGKERREPGIVITAAQGGWSQVVLERMSSVPCRYDPACAGSQQHRPKDCINTGIIES